jgi:hypothetical protein
VTWHAAITHSTTANVFTVPTTNTQVPGLSAKRSFQVNVIPRVRKLIFQTSKTGRLNSAFNGDLGSNYDIEVLTNLDAPNGWQMVFHCSLHAVSFILANSVLSNVSRQYHCVPPRATTGSG